MRYLLGKPSEILTLNELERLSFVLQHPLGGNMEDGPMDLVRYFIPGHTNSSRINRNKKVSIVIVEAELRIEQWMLYLAQQRIQQYKATITMLCK